MILTCAWLLSFWDTGALLDKLIELVSILGWLIGFALSYKIFKCNDCINLHYIKNAWNVLDIVIYKDE